jgi:azurin
VSKLKPDGEKMEDETKEEEVDTHCNTFATTLEHHGNTSVTPL